MRKAEVYWNLEPAAYLTEQNDGTYTLEYLAEWLDSPQKPPISLTIPKSTNTYKSDTLFPFFFNMLAEGANKRLQCRQLKIDEEDDFGLLLATSGKDTIGAVSLKAISDGTN